MTSSAIAIDLNAVVVEFVVEVVQQLMSGQQCLESMFVSINGLYFANQFTFV